MYAVIFRAEINKLDEFYSDMAVQMRNLAISKYNCTEFVSVTQGSEEIAISYWQDLDHITQWKSDAKHLVAQKLGQTKWYKHYKVQVVDILREYSSAQPVSET